jgi:hypothetical protein
MLSRLIQQLSDCGALLFPIDEGRKVPLIRGWPELATSSRAALEAWRQQWPYCGFGWALSANEAVTDCDMHVGDDGIGDFRRLDGRDPRAVNTWVSSTRTGGLHVYWATGGRPFLNKRIPGTSIDIKCKGGFVGVPDEIDGIGNGRDWLPGKAPWEAPSLARAPGWIDAALRPPPATAGIAAPLSNDLSVRSRGRTALARACERIVNAPCGQQDVVRHAQSFYVGGLCARGDLDVGEALAALTAAAEAMPTYGKPWRNLGRRVAASFESGRARPLPLSITERYMRDLKDRMRLRRPSHG